MKEKYTKNKKRVKSFLSIATTLIVIAAFSFFSGKKYLLFAIISLILGILFFVLFILCNKYNNKLIETMKRNCPICNKEVIIESDIKYYVNGCVVSLDDLNNENFKNMNKEKLVFNFYKCVECNYCLTEIFTYTVKDNCEKLNNRKYNVDFNYHGDY